MKYVGSKNRLAKHILPLILEGRTTETYVEPFAGGMNLIQHVSGDRIANDINSYVVEMFHALVYEDWQPPQNMSEQQYNHIKQNMNTYSKPYVGFVGIGCSYSGKWFGGYARGNRPDGTPRNSCRESYNNVMKQKDKLKGVQFFSVDYQELDICEGSIVYCDIPYKNSVRYKDKFDHNKFWTWAKENRNKYKIFVSEYDAPDWCNCVWQKEVSVTVDARTTKHNTERLFKL